jgi:L-threonylcarbamoyladenylate synthase
VVAILSDMGREIERAAGLLRSGGLVAFPTETVYGLGANALDALAVRRIFEVKGRPFSSPVIVHVADAGMARELALVWPAEAEALARRFWPGPLTLIVPKKTEIPDIVTAGLPGAGFRVPSHPLALELLRTAGIPIAAPSANRFTQLSPTTAEHVRRGLGDAVDMILDGGDCTVGIESTVISFCGEVPRILRPGFITRPQIEALIGPVEVGGGAESPGQHPRHYSPRTRIVLGDSPGTGRGFRLDGSNMPDDAAAYGARLYRVLHELDEHGFDWIAIEPPPDTPDWAGIRDRLRRASSSSTPGSSS